MVSANIGLGLRRLEEAISLQPTGPGEDFPFPSEYPYLQAGQAHGNPGVRAITLSLTTVPAAGSTWLPEAQPADVLCLVHRMPQNEELARRGPTAPISRKLEGQAVSTFPGNNVLRALVETPSPGFTALCCRGPSLGTLRVTCSRQGMQKPSPTQEVGTHG